MTETLAAFLLAATLAALAVGGPAGRRARRAGLRPGRPLPAEPAAGRRCSRRSRPWSLRPGDRAERLRARALVAGGRRRDARPLGLAERPGLRRAGLDDDPRRLHAGPGEQPGLLRRGPRRSARARSGRGANQGRWFDAVGRLDGGAVGARGRPAAPDAGACGSSRRRPRDFARASLARLGRFWGVAPAGAVYPALAPAGDGCSGRSRSGSPWSLGLARRELWRWPRIAAPAIVLGADGGPRRLLDRHADACPGRPGDRPDRGRCAVPRAGSWPGRRNPGRIEA